MAQLKVALDWTPNTNHAGGHLSSAFLHCCGLHFVTNIAAGFYVAKAKGYFQEAKQSVQFLSPHLDGYKATPGEYTELQRWDAWLSQWRPDAVSQCMQLQRWQMDLRTSPLRPQKL